MLTASQFRQMGDWMSPHMQTVAERQTLLRSAFGHPEFFRDIQWEGTTREFVMHLLGVLLKVHRYRDEHPLRTLLIALKGEYGTDVQTQIDALLPSIDSLPADLQLPTLPISLFISYARADDQAFVDRLYNDLRAHGYNVWLDRYNMPNRGESFGREIENAIFAADRLLVVCGDAAYRSEYVRAEWTYALALCKPVHPLLRLGDFGDMPERLRTLDARDFRAEANYNQQLQRLIEQIEEQPVPLGELRTPLPNLPAGFVARPELDALVQSLRNDGNQVRAIISKQMINAVCGVGGIGKTILASALCRRCDVRQLFPHGIFWIEIGETANPVDKLSILGAALGISPSEFTNEGASKTLLAEHLRDKRCLIVLDDVWNHEIAKPFRDLLSERSQLLITTRKRDVAENLGAQAAVLDKLSPEQGVELIRLRCPEVDLTLARQIAEFFDGHTLAISIAAAWLERRGAGRAGELLNRLREGRTFRDLALAPKDKNLHLEHSLYLSYTDLPSDAERYRFRQLGAFAPDGMFDSAASGALWGMTGYDLDDALEFLVGAGLLFKRGERYYTHSLLYAYARALLNQANEFDSAARRHCDHYYALSSEGQLAESALIANLENILGAVNWLKASDFERASQWLRRLNLERLGGEKIDQVRATFLSFLREMDRRGDTAGRATWLLALSDLERRAGNAELAMRYRLEAGEVDSVLEQIFAERRRGNYLEARRLFEQATAARPQDSSLWQAWALMEKELRRYDEARRLFERATQADPSNAQTWQAWALMEKGLWRYDQARRLFERATQAEPHNASAWQAWALMEKGLRRYDEARRLFERATQADPSDPVSWQAWALIEKEQRRYDEARRLFERAIQIDPSHAPTWQAWAVMEREQGNYDKARELFQKGVEADPRATPLWQSWALMEKELGNYDQARVLFQKAVDADPYYAPAWQAWALMEEELSNHTRAEELFRRAADADPFN